MHAGISKATAHEKVVVVGQSDLHNGTVLAHANSDDSEIGGVLHMRGAAKSRMCARNELHNLLEDLRKEADANLTNNASTNGKATHTGPGDASSAASPSLAGTAGKHGQQPLLPEATLAMAPEDEPELHPASVQVPGGRASAALTGGPSAALTGGRATATSTGGALAQAGESQQGLQPQASAGLGRSGPADQAAIMPPASGPASVQQAAQVLQPPARPAPPALPAPNSSAHAAADPAHDVASRLGRRAVVAAAAAAAPASDAAPAVSLPHPSATGLGSDCPEHWTAAPQGRQGAAPGRRLVQRRRTPLRAARSPRACAFWAALCTWCARRRLPRGTSYGSRSGPRWRPCMRRSPCLSLLLLRCVPLWPCHSPHFRPPALCLRPHDRPLYRSALSQPPVLLRSALVWLPHAHCGTDMLKRCRPSLHPLRGC
jgi:hypothetical protein